MRPRSSARPLRVLHGPWNLAGQQASLAAAERRQGLDSWSVALFENPPGFPPDEALALRGQKIRVELARFRLLWRAIRWADVIHFSFGQSFLVPSPFPSNLRREKWGHLHAPLLLYAKLLWYADLPLLKRLGKTLVVSWQGDDARQGDRSRELFDTSIAKDVGSGYYTADSDVWKRRVIERFARYADRHYALNPDLMHVLPEGTRFLPYASFDPAGVTPRFPLVDAGQALRIAHAPTNRDAKGTRYVLEAVDRLRAEGASFEFDLIEKVDRSESLRRLAAADIVVDQLLVGWYGGLGLEAMSLGKVVVAYIRDSDLRFLPSEFREALPVVVANPDTVTDVLRGLLNGPRHALHDIGVSSRRFAEGFHSPDRIAASTAADYRRLSTKTA
ncbi:MAG: glycosyltransferase [Rhizobiaceae bacterium]